MTQVDTGVPLGEPVQAAEDRMSWLGRLLPIVLGGCALLILSIVFLTVLFAPRGG